MKKKMGHGIVNNIVFTWKDAMKIVLGVLVVWVGLAFVLKYFTIGLVYVHWIH